MALPLKTIVEGTTERQTFTVKADGGTFNGTGITVSNLYITGRDGTEVNTTGDFGWSSQSTGVVYYDPDAADFDADLSPYTVRIELTDGNGKIAYSPSGNAAQIVVKPLRL